MALHLVFAGDIRKGDRVEDPNTQEGILLGLGT